jgi:hypothetical protein
MNDHGVTVTIKYGKSYEDTWAVFKAADNDSLKALVGNYFGVEPEVVAHLTNHELVLNMTSVAHGSADAAALLGGTVIPASESVAKPVERPAGNPWAGLGDTPVKEDWPSRKPEHEEKEKHLLNVIAASKTVAELQKKVWIDNREGYEKYPTVQAAYKARGKELK